MGKGGERKLGEAGKGGDREGWKDGKKCKRGGGGKTRGSGAWGGKGGESGWCVEEEGERERRME